MNLINVANGTASWFSRGSKIGLFVLLSLFSMSELKAQTPLQMNGKLKLVGKQLSNECGDPVQLRGMSSHGLQWHLNCMTASSVKSLATDWKADVIRLAMYVEEGGYVGGTTTQSAWKQTIDSRVTFAAQNGLYCIIDWHVLTPGDPNADLDAAKDFWDYMSSKHKNDKNVIYEICNEPNGVSWSTVKTYANAIIPIIRANDPETIIIVGTPNYSSDLSSPVSDPLPTANTHNVMYTYHFYAATHMYRLNDFTNSLSQLPVFVTEWGTSEASGTGSLNLDGAKQWLDVMAGNNPNKMKISWCNWSFSDASDNTSAALAANACGSQSWTTTSTSGAQVKTWVSSADNFTTCNLVTCKSPNLGSDVSLCGVSGGITLNSGLTTATNRTFTWKKDGQTISGTGPTLAVTQAGKYTVVVDSGTCEQKDSVIVSASLPAVNLGNAITLCNPATATLDAGVTGTGIAYAWTKDGQAIATKTKTLSVSYAGTYAVTVSATGCDSKTGSVVVTSSLPTITGDDNVCANAPVTLTASGSGPFSWYIVAMGGSSVATGTTYTPSPTATTTYYVESGGGTQSTFGPTDPGTAPWGLTSTDYSSADKQLLYTASANETLVSLDVSSPSAQSIQVNVTDNGSSTLVKTVTVTVPSGMSTVAIGASLTSGKTYRLDGAGTTGSLTFRQNSTGNTQPAVYPQTIANVGTLTSNASYSMGWSLFYNVKISTGSACARAPFTVTTQTCSGLEDEEALFSNMQIYPNPFESGFTVKLGANYGVAEMIEVRDMEGRLVDLRQGASIASTTSMGEHLPAGQYFVRVVSANKVAVKPVIKMK